MYVVYFWAWQKYSTVVIDGMLGRRLECGCSRTTQIERQWATNINIALNSPNAFPMETNPLDSSPNQELKALLNDWALQKTLQKTNKTSHTRAAHDVEVQSSNW